MTLPVTHTSGEAFLCPGTPGSLTSGVEGKEKRRRPRRKMGRWKVRRGVWRAVDRKNHPPKQPHPNRMCASSSSKSRRPLLQSFILYSRDNTAEASILFATQVIFLIWNCPVAQPNIKLLRSNSPLLFVAPRPLLPLKMDMTPPPIIGCSPTPFSLTASKWTLPSSWS